MTRSILKAKQVPNYLWGEAVNHSTYIINRIPTRALKEATPYQLYYGRKPDIEHMRVFGCIAYAKVAGPFLKKLDDRSRKTVHLGSEPGSKAYRLFDPESQKIIVSRDVIFNENSSWKWDRTSDPSHKPDMFWVHWPSLIDTGEGPVAEVVNTEGGDGDGAEQTQPQDGVGQNNRHLKMGMERNNHLNYEDQIDLHNCHDDMKTSNYHEAKDNPMWVKAMTEEIDSIEKNGTWELVERPNNATIIGLKWVFKVKRDANGSISRYKARPGIDFEEVFAPVARIETVRLLIALAASKGWELHHLDVKSAFLHGELQEEVFVHQPEGFVKKGREDLVYKLIKALYGLRQAPRTWNIKLDGILKEMKFQRCMQEQAVYRRRIGADLILVGVYVDDLVVTGSSINVISKFKQAMASNFDMTDLGVLRYYLGIEVYQQKDDIIITQEGYAKKVLKDAGMYDCNPTLIPMDSNVKFSKDEKEEDADATEYRSLVGRLRYLLQTRPDLSYAVGITSRYMQTPKKSHMVAIKQILRYVKGTLGFGIRYARGESMELIGYSDSSHNIDQDDGRSTTGHIFYLVSILESHL
ncbi:hypothetical protein OSB04_015666 [Centaurea solstitialis]|uniref:Reverse transcriptase Ty1/copia-type domain-containing protein n=1 Tax=Centaurea solstitialis TaxID=347529 RepID=A0AA38TAL3_9ASTR|nr:hypothetical protein OSB04_015666 [Centaurea solstitialis]